ncbi:MAG: hypothetical protein ACREOX_11105, partial [Stenotrophomonas sp.]
MNTPLATRTRVGLAVAIACALATSPILAAAADTVGGAESDARDTVTLSEIRVLAERIDGYDAKRTSTATRTGADVRDVAQSIQIVPRAVIDDQQLNDLTSVVMNVSGIQPGTTAGNR